MYLLKFVVVVTFTILHSLKCDDATQAIVKIFSPCKKKSPEFDECMKKALNDLRPYFKKGIPELGVAPFDPHFASEVKQTGTIFGLGYTLILRNVYERGWTQSTVTRYKTNWDENNIMYSQYFPEKSLEGQYQFKGDVLKVKRSGSFNLTLREYSQTTRVSRAGSGVHVRVQIDDIGDMNLHVANLLQGRIVLERWLDGIINASWRPGFAVIRPLINDLVSAAFTDIFTKSFKHFNEQKFVMD